MVEKSMQEFIYMKKTAEVETKVLKLMEAILQNNMSEKWEMLKTDSVCT